MKTPLEVAHRYVDQVWNKHKVELIPELCADPVLRHDFTRDFHINHQQQRERILSHVSKQLHFKIVFSHGDAQFATIVWQITSANSDFQMAGIEVMKVVDGKIVENWNGKRDLLWD